MDLNQRTTAYQAVALTGLSYSSELFVKAYAFDFDGDLSAAPLAPEIYRASANDIFVSSEDFWGSPKSGTART